MNRRDFLKTGSKVAAGFVATTGLVSLVDGSVEEKQEEEELQEKLNAKKVNLVPIIRYGLLPLAAVGFIYSLIKTEKDARKCVENEVQEELNAKSYD